MTPSPWCDFDKLSEVISSGFQVGENSVHGPEHWKRVEQNGLWLSTRTGADTMVTHLFAWFHDSKRENDSTDPDHGRRGAEYAASLRRILYDLDDQAFEKFIYACTWHTDKDFSSDPTIGTCWDSDRLDLGRVGILPSAKFMSTDFGKEVAHVGSFTPFLNDIRKALNQSASSHP